MLPDGLNWLCYFAGSSKSHRENSISLIFLESPHQVHMKNVVKSSKHFFGCFNTLNTHSKYLSPLSFSLDVILYRVSTTVCGVGVVGMRRAYILLIGMYIMGSVGCILV